MKKYLAVSLLVFVIFAAGCAKTEKMTAREKLLYLQEKGKGIDNLHLHYNITLGMSGFMQGGKIQMGMDTYRLDNKSKSVISISMMGRSMTMATYKINGHKITCQEGSYGAGTQDGVSCSLGEEDMPQFYQKPGLKKSFLENISVTETGVKEFAGRDAVCFRINVTKEDIGKMMGTDEYSSTMGTSPQMGNITLKTCLDKKLGYMALMEIKTKSYSEIKGEIIESTMMEFTVDEMSKDVKPKIFELPKKVAIQEVSCTAEGVAKIEFLPFEDFKEEDVSMKVKEFESTIAESDSPNIASEIRSFEENSAKFDVGEKLSGSYDVEICVGDSCQSKSCYVWEEGGGFGSYGPELSDEVEQLVDPVEEEIPGWWSWSSGDLTNYIQGESGGDGTASLALDVQTYDNKLYESTSSLHYGVRFKTKEGEEDKAPYLTVETSDGTIEKEVTADTRIDGRDSPSKNHGEGEKMACTETKDAALLKFDVSGIDGDISDVTLNAYSPEKAWEEKRSVAVWSIPDDWSEMEVTWNSKPGTV